MLEIDSFYNRSNGKNTYLRYFDLYQRSCSLILVVKSTWQACRVTSSLVSWSKILFSLAQLVGPLVFVHLLATNPHWFFKPSCRPVWFRINLFSALSHPTMWFCHSMFSRRGFEDIWLQCKFTIDKCWRKIQCATIQIRIRGINLARPSSLQGRVFLIFPIFG